MADLEDIGVLVPWAELFPLARNSRGLNRTTNPVGGILVSSDVNLPFPEDLKNLSGTVSDASDNPAERDVIAIHSSGKMEIRGRSAADGTFTLAVPDGVYRVVFTGESGRNDLIVSGVEPV